MAEGADGPRIADRMPRAAVAAACLSALPEGRSGAAPQPLLGSLDTLVTLAVVEPLLPVDEPPAGVPSTWGLLPLPRSWRRPRVPWPPMPVVDAGLGLLAMRPPPLTGREAERDRLWAAVRGVEATGRGRVVQLRGTKGTGRTRLARWLEERVHEVGAAALVRVHVEPDAAAVEGLRDLLDRPVLHVLAGGAEPPAGPATETLHLQPLAPFEQEALIRHILPLEASWVVEVADRTHGMPGLAITLLHALVARDALTPGPDGFVPDEAFSVADPAAELARLLSLRREGRGSGLMDGFFRGVALRARAAWSLVGALGVPATDRRYAEALEMLAVSDPGTLGPRAHRAHVEDLVRVAEAGGWPDLEASGRLRLATLLSQTPRRAESAGLLRRAVELAEVGKAWHVATLAHYQVGYESTNARDFPAAEASFRRCLALDDRAPRTGARLGWAGLSHLAAQRGEGSEAVRLARKSVDAMPGHHDSAITLGVSLIHAGRPEEAVPWLQQALEGSRAAGALDDEARILLNLGAALHACSRLDEARRALLQGLGLCRTTGRSEVLFRLNLAMVSLKEESWADLLAVVQPMSPVGAPVLDLAVAVLRLVGRAARGDPEVASVLRTCRHQFAVHGVTHPMVVQATEVLVQQVDEALRPEAEAFLADQQRNAS